MASAILITNDVIIVKIMIKMAFGLFVYCYLRARLGAYFNAVSLQKQSKSHPVQSMNEYCLVYRIPNCQF